MGQNFQANYEQLTQIQSILTETAEEIEQLERQLNYQMEDLRKGWQGDAARAFFSEMEADVLPGVKKLFNALYEADRTVGATIGIIRESERIAADLFAGNSLGGRVTADATKAVGNLAPGTDRWFSDYGNVMLNDGDYHGTDPSDSNIFFFNGIWTEPGAAHELLNQLEEKLNAGSAERVGVTGIYNQTDGTIGEAGSAAIKRLGEGLLSGDPIGGLKGAAVQFLGTATPDILQAGSDMVEGATGIRIGPENPAVERAYEHILPKLQRGETVTLMGHSQGAAIVDALEYKLMAEDSGYKDQIKVTTFGRAGHTYGSDSQLHIRDVRDPVAFGTSFLTPDLVESTPNERIIASNPFDFKNIIGHNGDEYISHLSEKDVEWIRDNPKE